MNTDPTSLAIVAVLFVAGGFLLGLSLSRGGRRLAKRCRELEQDLARSESELAGYRDQVGQHFNATGELLRTMTEHYRAVYEHLAEGARNLCPDQAASLSAGARGTLLDAGRTEPATPARATGAAAGPADAFDDDELEVDEDDLPEPGGFRH